MSTDYADKTVEKVGAAHLEFIWRRSGDDDSFRNAAIRFLCDNGWLICEPCLQENLTVKVGSYSSVYPVPGKSYQIFCRGCTPWMVDKAPVYHLSESELPIILGQFSPDSPARCFTPAMVAWPIAQPPIG